jgi:hypothetical protein
MEGRNITQDYKYNASSSSTNEPVISLPVQNLFDIEESL